MDSGNRIEICDKDGWHKEFDLEKRLTYIGSDPRNDIVLNPMRGAGVAPRHLQLITATGSTGITSAINLSPGVIPIGDGGNRTLEPNSVIDISDGDQFHVGDFVLVFHLTEEGVQPPVAVGVTEMPSQEGVPGSSPIGVRIHLPLLSLSPDIPLDGVIYVCNQGTATGVQFYLQLEGLPQDCYEIAPAPILFPGAEKGVPFRLHHPKKPDYPAGFHKIVIRAQATDAYPGISSTVSREVRVLPYYYHTLRILS
jgi:hypothetical protein